MSKNKDTEKTLKPVGYKRLLSEWKYMCIYNDVYREKIEYVIF